MASSARAAPQATVAALQIGSTSSSGTWPGRRRFSRCWYPHRRVDGFADEAVLQGEDDFLQVALAMRQLPVGLVAIEGERVAARAVLRHGHRFEMFAVGRSAVAICALQRRAVDGTHHAAAGEMLLMRELEVGGFLRACQRHARRSSIPHAVASGGRGSFAENGGWSAMEEIRGGFKLRAQHRRGIAPHGCSSTGDRRWVPECDCGSSCS